MNVKTMSKIKRRPGRISGDGIIGKPTAICLDDASKIKARAISAECSGNQSVSEGIRRAIAVYKLKGKKNG